MLDSFFFDNDLHSKQDMGQTKTKWKNNSHFFIRMLVVFSEKSL
jgi:hypothetical protein